VSTYAIVALLGYLLGSLPAGYIAGRLAGVDIRTRGSGNIGATNVTRVLGKGFGYPVFICDLAKGIAAVVLARHVAANSSNESALQVAATVGGLCAVLGHSFPVWLRFRGGKGVATFIGVLFALMPISAIVVCAVWLVTFEIGRYVSLASIIAAIALPISVAAMLFLHWIQTPVLLYFSLGLSGLIVIRHRANLSRLVKGTEPRFTRR
jgi:acyl phosphate:glycerol-3-phosphate acyltransferase